MNKAQAREFSFQYLFHLQLPIFEETAADLKSSAEDLKIELVEFQGSSDIDLSPDGFDLALNHVQMTLSQTDTLEEKIKPYLKNWKLERISKVDKTVLLLAVNEMESFKDTPLKVVINEAIEIAKKYGTEDSPKFVNAVLDKISKEYV